MIEEIDDFIGREFPTKKGGILKVVEFTGKRVAGCRIYKVFCAECAKDPEMYGNGMFEKAKNDLNKGGIPCGCSTNTQYTTEQWKILLTRRLKDSNITFKVDDTPARVTKNDRITCWCGVDGHSWRPTIAAVLHENSRCPKCAATKTGERRRAKQPEQKLQKKLDTKGYKFLRWKTESGDYEGAFCSFVYTCHRHGEQVGKYADFVRARGCGCPACKVEVSRVYGWYKEKQSEPDTLYIIKFNNEYLKVGRTFEIDTRIRHLKMQSGTDNIEVMHLYHDKHNKIYPLEQFIHAELRKKGFWFNVGWTTECFCLESFSEILLILEREKNNAE